MPARDDWGEGGAYEPYIGRWSRIVARRFIAWLAPAPDGRWLDIGCGTGALIETILDAARPSAVRGIDPSEDYIAFARRRITDPRAEFVVADAYDLPGDDDSYDFTVSGLALNFVPDAGRALAEMKRVTRTGGCVAAYLWDYGEGWR